MNFKKLNRSGLKTGLASLMCGLTFMGANAMADVMNPVIGNLLYEEQFNSLNTSAWNVIEGDGCAIGLCGWGNQELEYYRAANVAIENVPFEPNTRALAIQVRREAFGGKGFTSGKLDSHNKVQVQYGMIELRISTPAVGVGLWPAAWMLGTSLAGWPSKGELDIMEMGHRALGRAEAGFGGADINSYVGSNAIFYSASACVPENPTCAASTAWQTANAYVAQTPLVNRFVLYRMYWTDSQIRFTVVDNGVERDMYRNPIPITAESSEFQAPFYFLLNLAVGGNFTDAATDAQVTAPMPSKMYVDYIRVYQIDGKGEVKLGSQVRTEAGTYGVFTDNTPTSAKEVIGTTADFWIWNTASMTAIATTPFEGSNVLGLRYTPGQWFGGGIASRQAHDMSKFANGVVKFRIKVPANVAFRIGVADTYTNANWITFPANQTTYGLVRNGNWAQATIPVADLRGPLVALQSMASLFQFVNVDGQLPTAGFDMAIDDIVWECGTSAACQPTSSSSSVTSSSRSSVSSVVSSSASANVLLSTGRPMTASSNLQPAGNAVDGNAATRWESAHGAGPSWLVVDLGTVKALSQVVIDWEAANAADYTIQGSNDNANWTTLKTVTGGAFGNRTDTHSVSGNYRYVRIYCTARSVGNTWGYSIFELKVYGSNPASSSSSVASSVANSQLNIVAATASTQLTPAANAIDKNAGTRWESAHATDPSWLRLDLGSVRTLSSVAIDWEAANAANYLIQCSSDGTTWTTIATRTGGTFGTRTDTVAVTGNCRYVRIYGQTRSVGNQWGYSIWEARVIGR